MAATNYGQSWPASWTTDATIAAASLANSGTITSSAILNTAASPNEVLDTECVISFGYPNSAPTGTITVSILREVNGAYQAATDPGVYSFTFTPTQNATNNYPFTVSGREVGGFKVYLSNASGFAVTAASLNLYYRQSSGQFG